MYIKKFFQWIGLKERLDQKSSKPPYVNEGDIWWISFGENVGSEINGKSKLFSRPGVVIKKLSHCFYFVLPTTTRENSGNWYVDFLHHGKKMKACLHQARAVDYRRFFSKLGSLDDSDYRIVKQAFLNYYR